MLGPLVWKIYSRTGSIYEEATKYTTLAEILPSNQICRMHLWNKILYFEDD